MDYDQAISFKAYIGVIINPYTDKARAKAV